MKDLGEGFRSLNIEQFKEAVKNGIEVIDIRREDEWRTYGTIENSHKITFFDEVGRYDMEKWMEQFTKIVKSKEQPFILVCAHANRTKSLGEVLGLQFGYKYVWELDGGINYGWLDLGMETVKQD
jgi:rhodanese-related sulfurtransferase